MTAAQAEAIGLVWRLYNDDAFATEALTLATNLAAKPAQALAAMKQAFNASPANTLDAQLDLERDLQCKMGNTPDFREGVQAFLEKRPAVFSGR
jgi:2-(1,2-epoxy-1,2-dihydrophenyl)acetyl-CoA isomerase